jgi:hypothetical protein
MKTKSLKYFVNVSKDMTGTIFKSVEGMSNRYELVTDYNVGIDIKTKKIAEKKLQ